MNTVIFIGIAVFVLIVTWAVISNQKFKQNRIAAGEELADKLGATFTAEYRTPPDLGLDAFESMAMGRYPQICNLLSGAIEGIGFDIFDFSTQVKARGRGGSQDLHINHTVVALRIPNLALGRLRVRPKNIQDVTRPMVEVQDIEVPSDLDFGRGFIVQGDQPDAARQMLTEQVCAAILQHPKRVVEVDGEQVLIYQQHKPEPIESWLSLRDSALEVGLGLMQAA